MKHLSLDELLTLTGHSVVLMPSDASARQLRDRIAALRGEHDQAFLETVTVMPLAQWLAELWDSSLPTAQVLRPIQLLAIARGIIENSEYFPDNCLNSLAIVRQFVDAFQLHAAYQLGSGREDYLFSPEYQAFYHWREAMQQALDDLNALSSEQLPAALCSALAAGELALPDNLVIAESVTISPAAAAFIERCAGQLPCSRLQLAGPAATPQLFALPQRQQECEQAAAWAAEQLAGGANNVALLLPDMQAYRRPLERALRRQLYPQSLFAGDAAEGSAEPWVFEGSESLYAYPLIRAAWDLISLGERPGELEQLSRVLRSRFVAGWPQLRAERARFDRHCREKLAVQTRLADVLRLAHYYGDADTVAVLASVAQHLQSLPARQLPSAWVRSFDQLLLAAGWPNADDDDAVVADCRRGFSQAMDVFRALDRQLGEIGHDEALSWLQHILTTKRFSVSRDWPSPLRIMSYDDAVGLEFDAVWLMGLDDAALPRRAEPSPFLPQHLQQAAAVEACEAGLCLQRDRQLLDRLLTAAPQLCCSFAEEGDNGAPRTRCTLLAELTALPDGQPLAVAPAYLLAGDCRLPARDEVRAVAPERRSALRGGSGLFKEYAQSPFLAFVKYRLNLQEFPRPAEGLDHRLQGILVHDSLESVWRKLGDKRALDALDSARLEELVSLCVDEALQGSELNAARFGDSLLTLEKARVVALLCRWLEDKEKARIQDFEVEALESELHTELMGIPLRLRLDRIDRIGDKRLVIDYKTGSIDGKMLNSDQLTEPQLPIYALAASEQQPIDGVMLAQLKSPDELKIHMRSNWANSVLTKRAHGSDVDSPQKWQDELKAWDSALRDMASGILAGNIAHDYSLNMERSFSSYLLPLLRDAGPSEEGL